MKASEVQAAVKWGAKSFNVQIDPNEPLEVFQAQLYTLTGVPVERQKLLCKGKTIKVDADLQALVSSGCPKIMLMGTAEEKTAVKPPPEKTVFVEDLTPAQQAALLKEKKVEPLPNGIVNLGNTCYLASVLQMLRPAKDFSDLLKNYISGGAATAQFAATGQQGALRRLSLALKDFYNQWDQTVEAVSPFLLVPTLREAYPQFSRRSTSQAGTTGVPMQQDAEECLSCLMTAVAESLDSGAAAGLSKSLPYLPLKAGSSPLDLLFEVQVEVTSSRTKKEGEAEPKPTVQVERHRKLTCFLGTPQKPVSTIEDSLKFSLGDEVVNVGSTSAGASGTEEDTLIRSNRISSLALYLIVHFMRFEWKMGGSESEKAKICRSVKFSQTLDMFTYCTKELQDSFKVGRAIVALRREREASSGGAEKTTNGTASTESGAPAADGAAAATAAPEAAAVPAATNGSGAAHSAAAPAAEAAEAEAKKKETELLRLAGKPCPTGTYQLLSVVTHQGRYADSGHYVGWARAGDAGTLQGPPTAQSEDKEEEEPAAPSGPAAKRRKNVDMWRKFDDDKVSEVPWDSIDLAGGRSDYHVAYLLLMKHILVVPTEEELLAVAKQL
ncbi:ubiquitin carboxyl-terminal hydrolase, putative [Eimeria tenella]|uniref:Ubiquitin carboxyl-terminal hydrolase n=2 Tax=Eimeria tenella TaxID=5802 RepID=U6KYZ7_EIMTE|nr:ubiquitin carboxyl-terminal hydrolase, putative [Eimeria tenella]CDJ41534.1 ubiquitin carboxyl-terminal hydrolase, putative [Eimeria tenella]|eukprot:XP_013232284.1 ubiquitin carboxyl-terminal hydrolase, putative [Eimeria tenella]